MMAGISAGHLMPELASTWGASPMTERAGNEAVLVIACPSWLA